MDVKDKEDLKRSIREILHSRSVAVLATQGEGYPHVCLVAYAFSDDLTRIVFATSRTTRKYSNIQTRGGTSILVDTRTNEEQDFHRAAVVTAQGVAEEITGTELSRMERAFIERHPYLEDFMKAPTTVLMGIKVSAYTLVSRFQNVLTLDMDRGPSG